MPASFEFPLPLFGVQGGTFAERADIWKPVAFSPDDLKNRGSRSYGVIGRLKPGVTLKQAQAELDTVIAGWLPRFPKNYEPATKFGASLYAVTISSSARCAARFGSCSARSWSCC
jgi:hypothetical protein